MKRNAMRRNLRQSIWRSLGRYIAIAAIIAVGAGIFVGLLMTKSDMVATGQVHMDQQNMFDLRLVSTYGWAEEQVEKAAKLEGIEGAEGIFYTDLIARYSLKDEDAVYRFYAMPEDMNRLTLEGGRMPQAMGECLMEGFRADDSILGSQILLSAANDEDDLENMRTYRYTVVGYVATPLYMDMNRGTTSVGSGSLEGFVYVPRESLNNDYYTEIHLTLPGQHTVYSESYDRLTESVMDAIEPDAERLGLERFNALKAEAEEEYQDGYQEYLDGVADYEEGKLEAEQELADAWQELKDGEQEIEDTFIDLQRAERKLYDARVQLYGNQGQIQEALPQLEAQKTELEGQYAQLAPQKDRLLGSGMSLSQIAGIPGKISALQQQIAAKNEAMNAEQDPDKKAAIAAEIAGMQAQIDAISPYAADAQLAGTILGLESGLSQIRTKVNELQAGLVQIEEGLLTVKKNLAKVYEGYEELEEAKADIAEGWIEYEDGKLEAEQELADAAQELADAKIDLQEAREDIDAMEKPDVMILDRGSNVGYNNLDSASDIVQGVSRVFPVFFLLIASLVCITTMTRMIEEERAQIGTLKALGYSNAAIISKYLIYAGSSAVLGSGLGIAAGCTLFPMIIWEAYKIMLHIPQDIVLSINWPLAITVISVYTAVILAVTWYCCHKTLEEVPAELIRPKSPDAGKALLVEKLPFWGKISFLNKVTIRNIFRYRQRLAMMLVGIGGCTALLVTGFGLRDSIINVVDYQFEEVTLYDLSVYFRDDLDQQTRQEFLDILEPGMDSMFYHQSSVDMEFDGRTKELYLITAGEDVEKFIHFHDGETPVPLPGVNQVVLSVGVAENMGISVGDSITMRNSDLETLELTVSGIYDNHVDNYAVIIPQTMEHQWGYIPADQMAFVSLPDGMDVHAAGVKFSELDSVMNVTVSEDMAGMVNNMMEALDMVIVLIVFCAGLLAVTVLYNLTNININERIREIATIKVLGFNASETASYVFKENMALTVVGSVLGLGLGYLLLVFVISEVKIDHVWFKSMVLPMSYVYSFALTLLAAMVVNFIFYFKLQKINMAEALKSVE